MKIEVRTEGGVMGPNEIVGERAVRNVLSISIAALSKNPAKCSFF